MLVLGLVVGAHQPYVAILQLAHGPRQIRHHDIRHGFGRAARNALHGTVQAHGAVARRNDRMHAGRVGRAQASAQIVRVGHAIQYQQQRGLGLVFQQIQHLVDVDRQLAAASASATTPWCRVPRARPSSRSTGTGCTRILAACACSINDLHALVAARRLDVELFDGVWCMAQARSHGMKAGQNLMRRHSFP